MKLRDLLPLLEEIAPLHLAEEWDNVGLLAGDPDQPVRRVLLTIDLTAPVLGEAQKQKTDLILAYHPPIFSPLKQILPGRGQSPQLYEAIRAGIALYSFHTALDIVPGGLNDQLAALIGIENPQPLQSPAPQNSTHCKLVVFVPQSHLEEVSRALFASGAGNIGPAGKYSQCSFRTPGTGTFECGPESRPAIGTPGSFEQVPEIRLETIVPLNILPAAIKALRAGHPYEEPAYDIIPLLQSAPAAGLGRFGSLQKPVSLQEMVRTIKHQLKLKTLSLIAPAVPSKRLIRTAAVVAGSAGSLLRSVIDNKCDFFLTGELKHHHALELLAANIPTICTGHTNTERFILPRLAARIRKAFPALSANVSRFDRDPFIIV